MHEYNDFRKVKSSYIPLSVSSLLLSLKNGISHGIIERGALNIISVASAVPFRYGFYIVS